MRRFFKGLLFCCQLLAAITILRRPSPSRFTKCTEPLGLFSGAISDRDIKHTQQVDHEECGGKGRLTTANEWFCLSSPDTFYQISFREITIVRGWVIQKKDDYDSLLFSYASGRNNEFQHFAVVGSSIQKMIFSSDVLEYWLENVIYAHHLKFEFKLFGSNFSRISLEVYGCPYWHYAKAFGMSSNALDTSRLNVYSNEGGLQSPSDARFNIINGGWLVNQNDFIQTDPSIERFWYQVTLLTIHRLVYINVRQASPGNSYWVKFGNVENVLEYYLNDEDLPYLISPPAVIAPFQNSTHVFTKNIFGTVFQYVPQCTTVCTPVMFEFFGVPQQLAHHNWKLYKDVLDQIMFQDFVPSYKFTSSNSYFGYVSMSHAASSVFRTKDLEEDSCISNPDFCQEGLSASFWLRSYHYVYGSGNNVYVTFGQIQMDDTNSTCKAGSSINLDDEFAIHIPYFNALRYNSGKTRLYSYIGINIGRARYSISAYLNQAEEFVTDCLFYASKLKPSVSNYKLDWHVIYSNNIYIEHLINKLLSNGGWSYGSSITLVFKPIEQLLRKTIPKFYNFYVQPFLITECAHHKTHIVESLKSTAFTKSDNSKCASQSADQISFGKYGFLFSSACLSNFYIQVKLSKIEHISMVKVGSSDGLEGDYVIADFQMKYSIDMNAWSNVENKPNSIKTFKASRLTSSGGEYISLVSVIYARFLRIHPLKSSQTSLLSLRLDVVACNQIPAQPEWHELTQSVCVYANDEITANVVFPEDMEVLYVKLVYVSGEGMKCWTGQNPASRFACTSEIVIALKNEDGEIIGTHLPAYTTSEDEMVFKLHGPRLMRADEHLFLFMNDWNLNDNSGRSCVAVFAWGRKNEDRKIVYKDSCSNVCLCTFLNSSGMFHLSKMCSQSFYLTSVGELIHSSTGKCLDAENCDDSSCDVTFKKGDCNVKFRYLDNELVYNSMYLAAEDSPQLVSNSAIKLLKSADHKTFTFEDTLGKHDFELYSNYLENILYISAKETTLSLAEEHCSARDGFLFTLQNSHEAQIFHEFLKKRGFGGEKFIIGLARLTNGFKWLDGTPFSDDIDIISPTSPGCFLYDVTDNLITGVAINLCNHKFICKSAKKTFIKRSSGGIVSSGLQVSSRAKFGRGFHFSTFDYTNLALSFQTDQEYYQIDTNTNMVYWQLIAMSWSKHDRELKLFINGILVKRTLSSDLTEDNMLDKPRFFDDIANYVTICSNYDHSFSYQHVFEISQLNIWKTYLDDENFYMHYTEGEEINYSEYNLYEYSEEKWKIASSGCLGSNSPVGPCSDVDRLSYKSDTSVVDWRILRNKTFEESKKECTWMFGEMYELNTFQERHQFMGSVINLLNSYWVVVDTQSELYANSSIWCEESLNDEQCVSIQSPSFCLKKESCSVRNYALCSTPKNYLFTVSNHNAAIEQIFNPLCELNNKQRIAYKSGNERQLFSVVQFKVNVPMTSIIRSAIISFQIANSYELASPLTSAVSSLDDSGNGKLNCPLTVGNLSLTSLVSWTIDKWEGTMHSPDISSLLQHSIERMWYYDKEISVVFLQDKDYEHDIDLRFDGIASMHIYYDDPSPDSYLHLPPVLPAYRIISESFPGRFKSLTFWVYISGPGALLLWITNYSAGKDNLIFSLLSDEDSTNWHEYSAVVESDTNTWFLLHIHFLNPTNDPRSHIALDKLRFSTVEKETSAKGIPTYDPYDFDRYKDVLTQFGIPAPVLVYPFMFLSLYLKDYGPHLLHLKIRYNYHSCIPDQFDFPCSALNVGHSRNFLYHDDISPAVNDFNKTFSILLHLLPNPNNGKTIFIFGDQSNGASIHLYMRSYKFYLNISNPEMSYTKTVAFSAQVKRSTWTNVGFLYENNKLSIYRDLEFDKSINLQSDIITPFPKKLTFFNIRYAYRLFSGYLSCFQAYNKVLSVDEMRSLQFCPTKQDSKYHPSGVCENGMNVAFKLKSCVCGDKRFLSSSCSNIFKFSMYKEALIYAPFDFANVSIDEKSGMIMTEYLENNYHASPINSGFFLESIDNITELGYTNSSCLTFLSCPEGYVFGFWFLLKNLLNDALFHFAGFEIKFHNKTDEFNITADFSYHSALCFFFIPFPLKSWIYINFVVKPPLSMSVYLDGKLLESTNSCLSFKHTQNSTVSRLLLAGSCGIDEFYLSALHYPETPSSDILYNLIVTGESFVGNVEYASVTSEFVVSTSDLSLMESVPNIENTNSPQMLFISTQIHEAFLSVFEGIFQGIASKYTGNTIQNIRFVDDTVYFYLRASFTYVDMEMEEVFFNAGTEGIVHKSNNRMFKFVRLYDHAYGVAESGISFGFGSITQLSADILIDRLPVEDERNHHSFVVRIVETPVFCHIPQPVTYNLTFYSGVNVLPLTGLHIFMFYNVTLWSVTHVGYSPRQTEAFYTSAETNTAPPDILVESNYDSIDITFKKYLLCNWRGFYLEYRINIWYQGLLIVNTVFPDIRLNGFSDEDVNQELHYTVYDLLPYRDYLVSVATINEAGVGTAENRTMVTLPWYPSASPTIIDILHFELNSFQFIFTSINVSDYNYKNITYRTNVTNAFTGTHVHEREISNETVLSLDIGFSVYRVSVYAVNVVGKGPSDSVCFASFDGVPKSAPTIINSTTTNSSVLIETDQMLITDENGVVRLFKYTLSTLDWPGIDLSGEEILIHSLMDLEFWQMLNSSILVNCDIALNDQPHSTKPIMFEIGGLEAFANYSFSIVACSKIGCSVNMSSVQFTTLPARPLCYPTLHIDQTINFTLVANCSANVSCVNSPSQHCCLALLDTVFYLKSMNNMSELSNRNFSCLPTSNGSLLFHLVKPFYNYTIIAYFASDLGVGPMAAEHYFTAESYPSAPPVSITATSINSTAIFVNISQPLLEERNGIIIGYTLNIYDHWGNERIVTWNFTEEGTSGVLTRFEEFTFIGLNVSAFTAVGSGPFSSAFNVTTMQSFPSRYPEQFSVAKHSAFEINVTWDNVAEIHKNGIIFSYLITISGQLANQTWHNRFLNLTADSRSYSIDNLFPATNYTLNLRACTSKGCGENSILMERTDDAVPLTSLRNLTNKDVHQKECLHIKWTSPDNMLMRGDILFCKFSLLKQNLSLTHIVGINNLLQQSDFQNLNQSEIINMPDGWSEGAICHLDNDTSYIVTVQCFNKAGGTLVTEYAILKTVQNFPSAAPGGFYGFNTSASSLYVHWKRLSSEDTEGNIHGYFLYYTHVKEFGECVSPEDMQRMKITGEFNLTCNLTDLSLNGIYALRISAYNNVGNGPVSNCTFLQTDYYVDGNWTEWTSWGKCSESCGIYGYHMRYRECTNPWPMQGGSDCVGLRNDVKKCERVVRCDDAIYYGPSTTNCDDVCSSVKSTFKCVSTYEPDTGPFEEVFGYESDYYLNVNLTCDKMNSNQTLAFHPSYKDIENTCFDNTTLTSCNATPPDNLHRLCRCLDPRVLNFYPWSQWSYCSRTCGIGVKHRERICKDVGECTSDVQVDDRDCIIEQCPLVTHWGPWSNFSSCSVECNMGYRRRVRECLTNRPEIQVYFCKGNISVDEIACNHDICTVDGQWGAWYNFGECTQPCGLGGKMVEKRLCNDPTPQYGGLECPGEDIMSRSCNENIVCITDIDVVYYFKLVDEQWMYQYYRTTSIESKTLFENIKHEIPTTLAMFQVNDAMSTCLNNGFTSGSVNVNITVTFHSNSYQQSLMLQHIVETVRLLGNYSTNLLGIYSIDVPDNPPEFQVKVLTPTSIEVSWRDNVTRGVYRAGDVYLYYVFYREESLHAWNPYGTYASSIVIGSLRPATTYAVRLVVSVTYANGVASREHLVSMPEGAPFVAPPNFLSQFVSDSVVYLSWEAIPPSEVPGTLTGYRLDYRKYSDTRVTTFYEPITYMSKKITGLPLGEYFVFEVSGICGGHYGPRAILVDHSAEYTPSISPQNVDIIDRSSLHEIGLKWSQMDSSYSQGRLLGYRVRYILLRHMDIQVTVGEEYVERIVDQFTFDILITNLMPYSEYLIHLSAFTDKGDGPSFTTIGKTCRCPSDVYTNYYELAPYVSVDITDYHFYKSFFPDVITAVLKEVCVDCRLYDQVTIHSNKTKEGNYPLRRNEKSVLEHVGPDTQISFPIFGKASSMDYLGRYPFIRLIQSQGSAIVAIEEKVKVKGIMIILNAVVAAWPMLLISVLLALVCGLVMWLAEQSSSNSDLQIKCWWRGALEGFWLAFITMTTLGYGDFAPSTVHAKAIMIVWMLVGLVVVGFLMSSISTYLVINDGDEEISLYGTPTAVLPDSYEYNVAVRYNADIVKESLNFSLPAHVLEAVQNKSVKVGLLDAAVAKLHEEQLSAMGLKAVKVLNTASGFGVILSGELEYIRHDFKNYIYANQTEILDFIEKNLPLLRPAPTVVESQLLSDDEIRSIITNMFIVIACFAVMGLIWQFFRKFRENKKIKDGNPSDEIRAELDSLVERFRTDFADSLESIEEKHSSELVALMWLRMNFTKYMLKNGYAPDVLQSHLRNKSMNDARRLVRKKHNVKAPFVDLTTTES